MPSFGDAALDHLLPSLDHVVARAAGGGDHLGNMLAMHRKCNSAKGDRPPNGCERIFHHLVLAKLEMHPADMTWKNVRPRNTALSDALLLAIGAQ